MAGIYIHIPFCKQACSYCNFYFTTSLRLKDHFIEALLNEIEMRKSFFNTEAVETIYIGGGTPSLLGVDDLKKITEAIHKNFICRVKEFTIEANPDDLSSKDMKRFSEMKKWGLNRFSIGVQSFFDNDLRYMNRAHSAQDAINSVIIAQDAGFDSITIDLIYGTPTLENDQWLKNLEITKRLGIAHFSAYALTVEEDTPLFQKIKRNQLKPVSEEKVTTQFDLLMTFAMQNDFAHYEISNFARPGHHAVHNSNYWKGKPYLGLGPSAHSYKNGIRAWNTDHLTHYIRSIEKNELPVKQEELSAIQMANEFMMTSLRTSEGLHLDDEKIIAFKQEVLRQLPTVNPDFFIFQNNRIVLTPRGKHFADAIALNLWLEENEI
jgi:oxygen-independent coproporphyrinogen-3 oxidase